MAFPRGSLERDEISGRKATLEAKAALVQRWWPVWMAAVTLALSTLAPALALASAPGADEAQAILEKAAWLSDRGQYETAGELVSRAAQKQPDVEAFAVARAQIYLADKNPFWALKVLGEFIAKHPPACEARAHAARVHILEANLEQAEQVLDAPECDKEGASRLRVLLLRTELAELRGQRIGAQRLVQVAGTTSQRYVEDDSRLLRLARYFSAEREPTLVFRLDLGAGWASRSIGTVPLDLRTPVAQSDSAFTGLDLAARLVPVDWDTWRPVAEIELHLAQYLATPANDLSTRQPLVRWGLEFGRRKRRLLFAYAADWINLEGGKAFPYGSFAYAEAHRGEFHIRLDGTLHAWGTLGYRRFWQADRSRIESVHGLTRTYQLSDTIALNLGREFRAYKGQVAAYTEIGATFTVGLDVALPKGFLLREAVALATDRFPYSEGYFDADRGKSRNDAMIRVGIGLTAPEFLGLRFAANYGYANRDSNINAYDFADHRASISATWQADSDELRVTRIPKAGRVALPYPDDQSQAAPRTNAQVIEVIRQDEQQRGHSSCMQ